MKINDKIKALFEDIKNFSFLKKFPIIEEIKLYIININANANVNVPIFEIK